MRVRDTGLGMSNEEITVALTPFGQVDASHSRWREGTGLGLPIAKALVEAHGRGVQIAVILDKSNRTDHYRATPAGNRCKNRAADYLLLLFTKSLPARRRPCRHATRKVDRPRAWECAPTAPCARCRTRRR